MHDTQHSRNQINQQSNFLKSLYNSKNDCELIRNANILFFFAQFYVFMFYFEWDFECASEFE